MDLRPLVKEIQRHQQAVLTLSDLIAALAPGRLRDQFEEHRRGSIEILGQLCPYLIRALLR